MSRLQPVLSLLPFAVDTFTADSACKHQFLTHAHKDHTDGIERWGRHIFCTDDTASLAQLKYPALRNAAAHEFTLLEPFIEHTFEPPGMSGKVYRVNAIPVQHCEGAVAYLFRSSWFGNILHTGDGRLDSRFAQQVQQLLGPDERLDLMYFDCTYGDKPQEFPTISQAIQQVVQLVEPLVSGVSGSSNADSRVLLCCEGLGSEPVLSELSRKLGGVNVFMPPSAFFSDAGSPCTEQQCSIGFQTEELHRQRCQELQLLLPQVVTPDSSCSSGIQVHGGRLIQQHGREGLGRRLVIKVSTQWLVQRRTDCYKSLRDGQSMPAADKPVLEDGVHFVLYSMHSSRNELLALLKALRPRAALPFCGAADACLRPLMGSKADREKVLRDIDSAVRAARQEALAGSVHEMQKQQQQQAEQQACLWAEDEEQDKENIDCTVESDTNSVLQPQLLGACHVQQQRRDLRGQSAEGTCQLGVKAWSSQHQQAQQCDIAQLSSSSSLASGKNRSGYSKRQGDEGQENAGKRTCCGELSSAEAAASGGPAADASTKGSRMPLRLPLTERSLSTLDFVPPALRGLASVCHVVRAQIRYS